MTPRLLVGYLSAACRLTPKLELEISRNITMIIRKVLIYLGRFPYVVTGDSHER